MISHVIQVRACGQCFNRPLYGLSDTYFIQEVDKRLRQLIKEAASAGGSLEEDGQMDQLSDVEYYLQDILATIYSFLQIYPEAAGLFKQHLDITLLAQIYDQVLPQLFEINVPVSEHG